MSISWCTTRVSGECRRYVNLKLVFDILGKMEKWRGVFIDQIICGAL